ncbi:hypothetical protein SeMB42_g06412 [Synchytrium endobioticum]|uniref:Golgi apparatus membrane protein TVP38 n=1 Tax=Synchytrium endobioticum TaxID=286115 RepID=A0A507CLQ5_9FUNG|nr:hypothetical protein SeMB42_g06412 [Synchytrium endobioticum]TPX42631.1 hypothetical protein SeLEV6574_g05498 [Synchytrium endobioticum]
MGQVLLPSRAELFSRKAVLFWSLVLIHVALFIFFTTPVGRQFGRTVGTQVTQFGNTIRELGVPGALILVLLLIVTAIPPLFGFGTLLVLCGLAFDFPLGLIPAYTGGLLGALAAYALSRRLLSRYRPYMESSFEWVKPLEDTINKSGLKMLILIRLAPYPFGIISVLMGASRIKFRDYAIASAVALIKVAIPVYVGSTLKTLLDPKKTSSVVNVVGGIAGLILGVGIAVYLTMVVKRTVRQNQADQPTDLPVQTAGFLSIANQAIENVNQNGKDVQILEHVAVPVDASIKSQGHRFVV